MYGIGKRTEPSSGWGVTLILLRVGYFLLSAAGVIAFFWTFTGEWERYMTAIVSLGILAWLTGDHAFERKR